MLLLATLPHGRDAPMPMRRCQCPFLFLLLHMGHKTGKFKLGSILQNSIETAIEIISLKLGISGSLSYYKLYYHKPRARAHGTWHQMLYFALGGNAQLH